MNTFKRFKSWLINEAKGNLADLHLQKTNHYGSTENMINRNYHLYVDNGTIKRGYPQDDHDKGYISIIPGDHRVQVQKLHPQSKDFHQIMNFVKQKHNDAGRWVVEVYNSSHAQSGRSNNRSRTVDYWLSQPINAFELGEIPEFIYHGTSTNLWYDGISQSGLLPRSLNKAGAGGSYGNQGNSLSFDDRIYLSLHPDMAARMASQKAAEVHGGNPLILKISTKGLFPDKFDADEDSRRTNAKESSKEMGGFSYKGRIPASLIQPYVMGVKSNEKSHRFDKWVPFDDIGLKEHPLTSKINNIKSWFSSSDSPYYWALLDAGLIRRDSDGSISATKQNITDGEMRQLIKQSPWVQNADRISKDLNDWGMKGIKSLNGYEISKVPPQFNVIVQMLLDSKVYYNSNGRFEKSYNIEAGAINLAKMMTKQKMDYRHLINAINQMVNLMDTEYYR